MNPFCLEEQYFKMKIRHNLANKTLDDFFNLFNVAKAKKTYLINNNCCYINDQLASYQTKLNAGDYLMIDVSNYEKNEYLGYDYFLDILYEDDYLLIVNKPSNFIIYPDNLTKNNTMANIIANYYQTKHLNLTIRHCHRLDMETTGCLIYAKDLFTQSAMENQFAKRKIDKTYLAIVEGKLTGNGSIVSSIGKNRHVNGKMVVKKDGPLYHTKYESICCNQKTSLIKVKIEEGKTHQIRVHLASILHPLYGDKLYNATTNSRVMLHCYKMTFMHPILGKKLTIVAKVPQDFQEILKKEKLICIKKKNLL